MSAVTMLSAPPAPPLSPRARRLTPPSWFDLRLLMGVALVLGAILVGARVVSSARHTAAVLVAARTLDAGVILQPGDVAVAQAQLPPGSRYLTRIDDVIGQRLSRSVGEGELMPTESIASAPTLTTITVGLSAGAAPSLRRGQRIKVWVSTPTCPSTTLLADVTVQAVRVDAGGSLRAGTGGQDVVVSVPPEIADQVVTALALPELQLRAGVLGGDPAAAPGNTGPPLSTVRGCAKAGSSR